MQTNQPLVSVVMNCYNSDEFLKEAIESVLNQTYQNWEIIFWDNQSTDNSAKIVKSYDDERIKYFYAPEHTSLGEGRNKALEKINGDFISFLDCDDLYLPTKLEKTLLSFKDESIGLVYTNGYTLFESNDTKKIFYNKEQKTGKLFEYWLSLYQVMIPSVMFRKEVLRSLEFWFDTRFNMIEEFDFFMRISKDWKINYVDEALCLWRAHSGSLTWSKKDLFEKENKLFLDDLIKKYPELETTLAIKHFKSKIAYQTFYNSWQGDGVVQRELLKPYLLFDKRFLFIYLLSFFGLGFFNKILRVLGKNV